MFNEHATIESMMHDTALRYLAVAFDGEGAFLDAHVSAAKANLAGYLNVHADKFPTTEDAFNAWSGKTAFINALLTDTLGNTQAAITGSDDSWGDYIPDGLSQAQALTDDGYDGNGFTWYALNAYRYEVDESGILDLDEVAADHLLDTWGASMQDCTSIILTTMATILATR